MREKKLYKVGTFCVLLVILTMTASAAVASPSPPTNVSATLSGTSLMSSWTKSISPDVTQYRIHVYNKNGTTMLSSLTQLVDGNTVSSTITVPSASDCYTVHIRAYAGNSSSISVSSNIACDSGTITPPTGSTTPPVGNTTPPVGNTTPPVGNTTPPVGNNTTIRFVTIGDIHLTSTVGTDQYNRFVQAINYINSRSDVDFVVQMGDIVDSGTSSNFALAKSIISKLKVPYYVVQGNHDGSGSNWVTDFGYPTAHMENIGGYQLIFPAYLKSGPTWSFDYSTADHSKPTIIFNHGQVQPKPGGTSCVNDWGSYYSYACSMRPEVNKFTNLLGYYDGHVHTGTNQTINGALFVTEDNLGGNGPDSDYIGYTVIQNGKVTYSLLRYR